MDILVTGHSGFVGTALSRTLVNAGHNVIGASRSTGIDLCKIDGLMGLPRAKMVVHLAGLVGVEASWKNPADFIGQNCASTVAVAEYARRYNVPVVFLSSYMYGDPQYLPIDERHPVSCNNPYAYSKKLSEDILGSYFRLFGLNVVVLRPMNVYGPGMGNGNIIDLILSQAQRESKVVLRDLSPRRDYLHVDDLCQAVSRIVASPLVGGYFVYNLGTGVSQSVLDIVSKTQVALGRRLEVVETGEARINEIRDCYADISLFSDRFGWTPTISFEEGLRMLLKV